MALKEGLLKSLASKNVLVTGGTGMIGRQVVDILASASAHIRIVSLDRLNLCPAAEHIYGDLTDFSLCRQVCKDMDFIFNVAGVGASVKAAKTQLASHFVPMLMMNTNMLEACRLSKARKVVFTSTVGTYAKAEVLRESDYKLDSIPMDFASWSKRMAEAQIYAYKVEYGLENFAIVRPSNVYGPGDNFNPASSLVIPSLIYRIYNKEDPLVVWGNGEALRDFAYSRDIAEGIVQALYYGTKGEFVNLGSGSAYSIRELVATLNEFIDFNYTFDTSKPTGDKRRVMDISKARQLINYNPSTGLRKGLKVTWDWFVKNPEEYCRKLNYFEAETSTLSK